MLLCPEFFFPVKLCDEQSLYHKKNKPSENIFFLLPSDEAVSWCVSSAVDSAFPCCAGVSLVSRFSRRSCSVRTAPTHGPSGAALIQGSGAEPGRQRGRSSPETLKAAPSALLQRWPPPGYHPPDARQPRQPHRGKWLCRGFPAASNHRHPSSPSPGDHTSEVKGSQGWAPCRGSRGGSSRLFQLPGSPGVRPWAGGRLPPVSASVSTWLRSCVRVSPLPCLIRTLSLGLGPPPPRRTSSQTVHSVTSAETLFPHKEPF